VYRINPDLLVRREDENKFLLFNYRTYRCYIVNGVGYKILREILAIQNISERFSEEKSNFIKSLLSEGIIRADMGNEILKVPEQVVSEVKIAPIYTELKSPIRATWLITKKCNLFCKHCYIRAKPSVMKEELSLPEVKKILHKLSESGVFVVYFTGGEPLARPDFMDIIGECSNLGLKVGISTNGTLIDDMIARKLRDNNVFRAQVSIDGATRETHEFVRGTNTFNRTINAIKRLVENRIDVGITFVCHKGNLHELEEMVKLAIKLKVKGIKISPLMPWGRAKEELTNYIPSFGFRAELKRTVLSFSKNTGINFLNELHLDIGMPEENPFGCPVVMGFTILPDGKVIPCEVFAENLSPPVMLGDITKDSVDKIWNSTRAKQFRSLASIENRNECSNCPYLTTCGSYCLAEIYLNYGKLLPPKEYFKECKKIWALDSTNIPK